MASSLGVNDENVLDLLRHSLSTLYIERASNTPRVNDDTNYKLSFYPESYSA